MTQDRESRGREGRLAPARGMAFNPGGGKPGVPSGAAPLGWKVTLPNPRFSILSFYPESWWLLGFIKCILY
jgi:hypothetical protein